MTPAEESSEEQGDTAAGEAYLYLQMCALCPSCLCWKPLLYHCREFCSCKNSNCLHSPSVQDGSLLEEVAQYSAYLTVKDPIG